MSYTQAHTVVRGRGVAAVKAKVRFCTKAEVQLTEVGVEQHKTILTLPAIAVAEAKYGATLHSGRRGVEHHLKVKGAAPDREWRGTQTTQTEVYSSRTRDPVVCGVVGDLVGEQGKY